MWSVSNVFDGWHLSIAVLRIWLTSPIPKPVLFIARKSKMLAIFDNIAYEICTNICTASTTSTTLNGLLFFVGSNVVQEVQACKRSFQSVWRIRKVWLSLRKKIMHLAPIDFPCQKHINHSVNRLEWEKLRFIGRIFFSTAAVNEEIFHANIFVHIFHGSLKIRFLRLEWTKKTGRNVMLHVCYQTHIVLVFIYFMNIMFEFVVFLLFFKVYDNDCCYASVYRKI